MGALAGYTRGDGRFANIEDASLQPSTTKTATSTSTVFEVGDKGTLRLKLDVTAASGTSPTLDVTVQGSKDGSTNFYTLGTFAQKTAVSNEFKAFLTDRFVRISYVIAGTTPSFTFSVLGEVS